MRELKSRHAAVERAIASIEKYRKSPTNGTVSLEYIDRRYTYGRPCRHNFCEIITEFNVFDSEKRSMFMRLQVPVRFA